MRQLALDQRVDGLPAALGGEPGELHRGAHLRRREAAPAGQPGDEVGRHLDAGQRLGDQRLARARRRRLQLQVVLEAAPERRVDLLDAVGDPDHRHRVGLQDLVDPGLAADAAAGGQAVAAVEPRHQLRGVARDRRKHVLDLVEQQRHVGAGLEEHLADLQRAVAVAARQRIAVAVGVFDLVQVEPGGLRRHPRQLGLAGAGRPVEQHVDAGGALGHGVLQQRGEHVEVGAGEGEVGRRQLAARGRPGEYRHQLGRPLVLAHQHLRQLVGDLHQVGEVGDVVLGDQVLDHADALEPRAGAQRVGHVAGVDAGHRGDRRIGLLGVGDLELDQQAAQVALAARERAVQQQRALGRVELQQAGQRVDVLLDPRRGLLQAARQPVAGGAEHRHQVLRRVLDVLVEVEEERGLLVRTAPGAVALQEGLVGERLVAAPVRIALAPPARKPRSRPSTLAGQTRWRPTSPSRLAQSRRRLKRQTCRSVSVSTNCEHMRSSIGAASRSGDSSTAYATATATTTKRRQRRKSSA